MPPLLQKKLDLYAESTLVPIPDVAMSSAAAQVLYEEILGMLLGQVSVTDACGHIDDALAQYDQYS
jgi:hypothetical protein